MKIKKTKLKIDCKDCQRTYCDNQTIHLKKGGKGINPKELKPGDWFYLSGIIWIKKKNGKWKCRAFDSHKRLCRIWKYRSMLCREFFCGFAKKKKRKLPLNYGFKKEVFSKDYGLMFTVRFSELKRKSTK